MNVHEILSKLDIELERVEDVSWATGEPQPRLVVRLSYDRQFICSSYIDLEDLKS